MLWPTPADYAQAVCGYPDVSLLYPKLRMGKPLRSSTNQLLVYSGGFSTVFPIKVATDTYALRCWTRDIGDAKNRYEKIDAYLKQVRLPYFVDFEYVSDGILINGKKYPITRMEWANGELLRDFIEQNLQNATVFETVADEFQKMVAALHTHRISHGDLQNGNILLKRKGADVEIKLIDYDSLFVPALRGQSSPTPGLPEYQHPARGTLANEKVDYFSELVIYLSFLSLSEKPNLWVQFGDANRVNDGLLFSKADFENPNQSAIFQEFEKLSPDIQHLAATLKYFCAKTSIDQLEPLEAVLPQPDANEYTSRGFSFLNNSQYDEALAEFDKAIALDPNYKNARYGIGLVYLHNQQYTDAIHKLEQLIRDEPNHKEAHHTLGLAYFKSGENNKATAAANAALRIDPYYQDARQLLDAIQSMSPPEPPDPPEPVSPPPDPIPTPVINLWQYITDALKGNWHFVTAGTLGVALAICFVTLLTQINARDEVRLQNAVLMKQLAQKELENQSLTSLGQTLENSNEKLNRANGELQRELTSKNSVTNTTSRNIVGLRKQLNEQKDKNRALQNQLVAKDTEIQQLRNDNDVAFSKNRALQNQIDESKSGTIDQNATIRRLRKEKTETFTENRNLQIQLTEKISEAKNLMAQVQQLQNEKVEIQRQNQKLQDLIRQNRNLRNENTSLRDQLGKAKQGNTEELIGPEPPKKIRIQNYRGVAPRAASRNNQGCIEFERNNYDKAIKQFEQAIRANSEFAVAHYNLGCAYLEVKEYPEAISAFGKALAVNYKLKEAYYNLGITHLRKGTRQAAKSSIELALKIDSNYQRARAFLTVIENIQQ
ncbi:tetratricopeptide repeat protein [Candidatus Poribacteria bacterium]|nr:tetratricopeptide repeat protein [Candidatus Poribacteria bacterium]